MKVLSVGFFFPHEDVDEIEYESTSSLLDADIIFFRGMPDRYDRFIDHWAKELLEVLSAGRTVFFSMSHHSKKLIESLLGVFHLASTVHAKHGSEIRLTSKQDIFSDYWNYFGPHSSYEIYLDDNQENLAFATRTGNKFVGGVIPKSAGRIVFLPSFGDIYDSLWDTEDGGLGDFGIEFGNHLLSSMVTIDRKLRSPDSEIDRPSWCNAYESSVYNLPATLKRKDDLEKQIINLSAQIEDLKSQAIEESKWLKLFYGTGTPLEDICKDAMEVLGFSVASYDDGTEEFDLILEADGRRYLGEAEGKDNKPVNIEKLRQLLTNINADYARDCIDSPADGILFGNGQRLTEPASRSESFTHKCLDTAKRNGSRLINTYTLFGPVQYLLKHKNNSYRNECRRAIHDAMGTVVCFPEPPKKG